MHFQRSGRDRYQVFEVVACQAVYFLAVTPHQKSSRQLLVAVLVSHHLEVGLLAHDYRMHGLCFLLAPHTVFEDLAYRAAQEVAVEHLEGRVVADRDLDLAAGQLVEDCWV